jgi:hypothetical protein
VVAATSINWHIVTPEHLCAIKITPYEPASTANTAGISACAVHVVIEKKFSM